MRPAFLSPQRSVFLKLIHFTHLKSWISRYEYFIANNKTMQVQFKIIIHVFSTIISLEDMLWWYYLLLSRVIQGLVKTGGRWSLVNYKLRCFTNHMISASKSLRQQPLLWMPHDEWFSFTMSIDINYALAIAQCLSEIWGRQLPVRGSREDTVSHREGITVLNTFK